MLVHWIWLATLPDMKWTHKLALLEHFSDPEELYFAQDLPEALQHPSLENKDLRYARQVVKNCADRHIGILTIRDAAYPSRLRAIPNPPMVLYYKGTLPDLEEQPVIGIVGTRKASGYGNSAATQISRQIAACGGLVVSGGAAGIDTAALQGALDAGRPAVAVLGCGPDVVYPKSNVQLFEKLAENGCLISEYPPGTQPTPWQFPERNRIISGLSHGVVVVEAPQKSGALITAADAFAQGRDVFVVPGNIDVASCAGSNGLLQEYAHAVFSGWDVLKDYAPQFPGVKECTPAPHRPTDPQEIPVTPVTTDKKDIDNPAPCAYSDLDTVLEKLDTISQNLVAAIGFSPIAVDEVIAKMDMPAAEVLKLLTKLALMGVVENHPGKLVSVKR